MADVVVVTDSQGNPVPIEEGDYTEVRAANPSLSDAQIADLFVSGGSQKTDSGGTTFYHAGPGDVLVASAGADYARQQARADAEFESELAMQRSAEYIKLSEESAIRMAEYNTARFPEAAALSFRTSAEAAKSINAIMQAETAAMFDQLYPTWREDIIGSAAEAQRRSISLTDQYFLEVAPDVLTAADQMSEQMIANTNAMLAGELPPDVVAQLERQNAEAAAAMGVRGQAQANYTAASLGLTSLQMQQMGAAMAPGALGIASVGYTNVAQMAQIPVASGANVTNVMAPYRAPIADVSSLYGAGLGAVYGMSTINPTQSYSTAAQVGVSSMQVGAQQAQFTTQAASQQYWNQMNYNMMQGQINSQPSFGEQMALTAVGGAAAAGTAWALG